jgi:FAD:protein FMN transferase
MSALTSSRGVATPTTNVPATQSRPSATPELRFRALGTEVRVGGAGAEAAAVELHRLEAILTRFRASALTRLNERGELDPAPPELVAALRHALAVAGQTDGLITPLVLPALRWAGYRHSWPAPALPQPGDPPRTADWRKVRLEGRRIRLPLGAAVDLGGTAKSWIADRCFEHLSGDAVIDAGGDVIARSAGSAAINVARPDGAESLQLLLPPGRWGVATSGVLARAWPGGHHLIDPRSGRPAVTRFVQATAAHPDLRRAEVLAKLALLAPGDGALLDEAVVLVAFEHGSGPWHYRGGGRWVRT